MATKSWREFKQVGHLPTLLSAFLYFDVSFMAWAVLGPLASYLAEELRLTLEVRFEVVALPILAGAVLRIPMGMLSDHIGPKRTGQLGQLIVMAGMVYVSVFGLKSEMAAKMFGVVLGVAGASFAVAIPQASRWYPLKYQGVVMGVSGAGNTGVVLDSLFVPMLAERFGWQRVFGFLLIPLVIVFVIYSVLVRDAPEPRVRVTLANYIAVLRDSDTWWFMVFYSITFGGFVGLGSALPLYFTTWYSASGVAAGIMAGFVVLGGSLFRPVGGWLADHIGGLRLLQMLFCVVSLAYVTMALLPPGPTPALELATNTKVSGWSLLELPLVAWLAVTVFCIGAIAFGVGNGSIFQLVPLRFRHELGIITGLVGAAGGLGGFFLAQTLGWSRELTGGFWLGFTVFASLALIGLVGIMIVKARWRTTWGAVPDVRV